MERDDGDEMEVTWEELQKEIREEVENNELMVLKRTQLAQLQTLIEKREKQAVAIRKLSCNTCESVVECEAVMKELYSQLGMEYRDTDSEDEGVGGQNALIDINYNDGVIANNRDDAMDCDSQREEAYIPLAIKEGAVVVLTKLPDHKIRCALRPPKPQEYSSEEEDLISNDSDAQWEPPGGSSDSDHSYSGSESGSRKKREKLKTGQLNKEGLRKTLAPQAHTDTTTDATNKATTPQTNANTSSINKSTKAQTNTKTQELNEVCVPVVCSVSQAPPNPAALPPADMPEEEVKVDMVVLARKRTKTWQQGKILEIVAKENGIKYKVDFGVKGRSLLSGHHIAFDHTASLERLHVGARVVAMYQEADQSWFYSGVLAELPSRKNRMRFLVFFDDHTPSYVGLPLIHLVCRPLKDVWEDIEDATYRSFIEEYLKVYPNPPQAQYRVGQSLNVEFQGVQQRCEVEQVDGSLIHVVFQDDQHKEWIYRGSMRLEHMSNMKKRFEEVEKQGGVSKTDPKPSAGSTQTIHNCKSAQTASTLTTKPAMSNSTKTNPTKQIMISSKSNETTNDIPPHTAVAYTPHRCSPACLDRVRPKSSTNQHRGRNPLLVPLLYGFRRIKAPKRSNGKGSMGLPHVFYRSPCGMCLNRMANVQDYLYQTRCDFLYLEMFCLDAEVSITTTYEALPSKIYIPDLSQGKETQQVSCINEYNNIRPPTVTYSRDRVATGGVSINTSLNFMVGCDCTDGCMDSVACACHQLTIQATALSAGGPVDANAGYSYKRLNNRMVTGVYECNAQCRCDPHMCSNRLVQNGLQLRLQIFMTQGRGWGVRCLDDVAKGSFVCTFSGRVQRCEKKNTDSNAYFAKLNHIEGVEIHKPDYETEAYCSESEAEPIERDNNGHDGDNEDVKGLSDEDEESDDASDRDFGCRRRVPVLEKNYITRRNARILQEDPGKTTGSEEESAADSPARLKRSEVSTTTSTRCFFDKEMECYIIDAKMEGNLARYLNHSCSPNLFEQNVFVDTHDLRFPWLAFFTRKRIKAGTELTWDYRSFIGSAEGISRGLHCRCGSNNCHGKL